MWRLRRRGGAMAALVHVAAVGNEKTVEPRPPSPEVVVSKPGSPAPARRRVSKGSDGMLPATRADSAMAVADADADLPIGGAGPGLSRKATRGQSPGRAGSAGLHSPIGGAAQRGGRRRRSAGASPAASRTTAGSAVEGNDVTAWDSGPLAGRSPTPDGPAVSLVNPEGGGAAVRVSAAPDVHESAAYALPQRSRFGRAVPAAPRPKEKPLVIAQFESRKFGKVGASSPGAYIALSGSTVAGHAGARRGSADVDGASTFGAADGCRAQQGTRGGGAAGRPLSVASTHAAGARTPAVAGPGAAAKQPQQRGSAPAEGSERGSAGAAADRATPTRRPASPPRAQRAPQALSPAKVSFGAGTDGGVVVQGLPGDTFVTPAVRSSMVGSGVLLPDDDADALQLPSEVLTRSARPGSGAPPREGVVEESSYDYHSGHLKGRPPEGVAPVPVGGSAGGGELQLPGADCRIKQSGTVPATEFSMEAAMLASGMPPSHVDHGVASRPQHAPPGTPIGTAMPLRERRPSHGGRRQVQPGPFRPPTAEAPPHERQLYAATASPDGGSPARRASAAAAARSGGSPASRSRGVVEADTGEGGPPPPVGMGTPVRGGSPVADENFGPGGFRRPQGTDLTPGAYDEPIEGVEARVQRGYAFAQSIGAPQPSLADTSVGGDGDAPDPDAVVKTGGALPAPTHRQDFTGSFAGVPLGTGSVASVISGAPSPQASHGRAGGADARPTVGSAGSAGSDGRQLAEASASDRAREAKQEVLGARRVALRKNERRRRMRKRQAEERRLMADEDYLSQMSHFLEREQQRRDGGVRADAAVEHGVHMCLEELMEQTQQGLGLRHWRSQGAQGAPQSGAEPHDSWRWHLDYASPSRGLWVCLLSEEHLAAAVVDTVIRRDTDEGTPRSGLSPAAPVIQTRVTPTGMCAHFDPVSPPPSTRAGRRSGERVAVPARDIVNVGEGHTQQGSHFSSSALEELLVAPRLGSDGEGEGDDEDDGDSSGDDAKSANGGRGAGSASGTAAAADATRSKTAAAEAEGKGGEGAAGKTPASTPLRVRTMSFEEALAGEGVSPRDVAPSDVTRPRAPDTVAAPADSQANGVERKLRDTSAPASPGALYGVAGHTPHSASRVDEDGSLIVSSVRSAKPTGRRASESSLIVSFRVAALPVSGREAGDSSARERARSAPSHTPLPTGSDDDIFAVEQSSTADQAAPPPLMPPATEPPKGGAEPAKGGKKMLFRDHSRGDAPALKLRRAAGPHRSASSASSAASRASRAATRASSSTSSAGRGGGSRRRVAAPVGPGRPAALQSSAASPRTEPPASPLPTTAKPAIERPQAERMAEMYAEAAQVRAERRRQAEEALKREAEMREKAKHNVEAQHQRFADAMRRRFMPRSPLRDPAAEGARLSALDRAAIAESVVSGHKKVYAHLGFPVGTVRTTRFAQPDLAPGSSQRRLAELEAEVSSIARAPKAGGGGAGSPQRRASVTAEGSVAMELRPVDADEAERAAPEAGAPGGQSAEVLQGSSSSASRAAAARSSLEAAESGDSTTSVKMVFAGWSRRTVPVNGVARLGYHAQKEAEERKGAARERSKARKKSPTKRDQRLWAATDATTTSDWGASLTSGVEAGGSNTSLAIVAQLDGGWSRQRVLGGEGGGSVADELLSLPRSPVAASGAATTQGAPPGATGGTQRSSPEPRASPGRAQTAQHAARVSPSGAQRPSTVGGRRARDDSAPFEWDYQSPRTPSRGSRRSGPREPRAGSPLTVTAASSLSPTAAAPAQQNVVIPHAEPLMDGSVASATTLTQPSVVAPELPDQSGSVAEGDAAVAPRSPGAASGVEGAADGLRRLEEAAAGGGRTHRSTHSARSAHSKSARRQPRRRSSGSNSFKMKKHALLEFDERVGLPTNWQPEQLQKSAAGESVELLTSGGGGSGDEGDDEGVTAMPSISSLATYGTDGSSVWGGGSSASTGPSRRVPRGTQVPHKFPPMTVASDRSKVSAMARALEHGLRRAELPPGPLPVRPRTVATGIGPSAHVKPAGASVAGGRSRAHSRARSRTGSRARSCAGSSAASRASGGALLIELAPASESARTARSAPSRGDASSWSHGSPRSGRDARSGGRPSPRISPRSWDPVSLQESRRRLNLRLGIQV